MYFATRTADSHTRGFVPARAWAAMRSSRTAAAEDAPDIIGEVFEVVDIVRWDAPLVHLPDRAAARVFLRGRGLPEADAHHRAARLPVPLDVTKRGVLVWARRR